jgi:hypothetical protein
VTVATLVPTYLRLIPKYKVLVYNGDIDPYVCHCCLRMHTHTHTHTETQKRGSFTKTGSGQTHGHIEKEGLFR